MQLSRSARRKLERKRKKQMILRVTSALSLATLGFANIDSSSTYGLLTDEVTVTEAGFRAAFVFEGTVNKLADEAEQILAGLSLSGINTYAPYPVILSAFSNDSDDGGEGVPTDDGELTPERMRVLEIEAHIKRVESQIDAVNGEIGFVSNELLELELRHDEIREIVAELNDYYQRALLYVEFAKGMSDVDQNINQVNSAERILNYVKPAWSRAMKAEAKLVSLLNQTAERLDQLNLDISSLETELSQLLLDLEEALEAERIADEERLAEEEENEDFEDAEEDEDTEDLEEPEDESEDEDEGEEPESPEESDEEDGDDNEEPQEPSNPGDEDEENSEELEDPEEEIDGTDEVEEPESSEESDEEDTNDVEHPIRLEEPESPAGTTESTEAELNEEDEKSEVLNESEKTPVQEEQQDMEDSPELENSIETIDEMATNNEVRKFNRHVTLLNQHHVIVHLRTPNK